MKKPLFRWISKPQLEGSIFIVGLTGFGAVGKIAAERIIEASEAKLFAEIYSPFLPDYVIVDKDGIIRLPSYRFYHSNVPRPLLIMTGDDQPSTEHLRAHYQMCDMALDVAEEYRCQRVITMGGFPKSESLDKIYLAASDPALTKRFAGEGVAVYTGRIIGATGLLIGLAKIRGMDGICILGVTGGLEVDYEAADNVFNYLMRIIMEI